MCAYSRSEAEINLFSELRDASLISRTGRKGDKYEI